MEKLEPSGIRTTKIKSLGLLTAAYLFLLWFLNLGLPIDHMISNVFFTSPCLASDPRECWLLPKSDAHLTFLLHTLPVDIFIGLGVAAFLFLIAGYRYKSLKPYRILALLAIVGMTVVPAFVALMKGYTGHFCPSQTIDYASMTSYLKHMPSPKPRCYPAAHPSPGFGLMVIYFSHLPLMWRRAGLYTGLFLGSLLGLIQIARGEHFFSHVVATLMTAVFVGILVQFLIVYFSRLRFSAKDAMETCRLLFYNSAHR